MNAALHASALVVGEGGVLLRGPAGSGKSLLALTLIERVRRDGRFAALVADDRVWWETLNGRLLVRGAPATAGVCERRALGLVSAPCEHEAVIRLLVDLAPRGVTPSRMPEREDLYGVIGGVRLPRLRLDMNPGLDAAVSAVLAGWERIVGDLWRKAVNDDAVFA
jgi:HPr kinase/phosphorylase